MEVKEGTPRKIGDMLIDKKLACFFFFLMGLGMAYLIIAVLAEPISFLTSISLNSR
jgi:hypothetical protein